MNPDFYNWNHIMIQYCSSDAYSGNKEASEATGGFQFRGRVIVKSIIEDLMALPEGSSLKDATHLIFAGASAGAAGMRNNVIWVADQLPDTETVALNDAAYLPPPATDAIEAKFLATYKASYEFCGSEPDETCVAAEVAAGEHPSVCLSKDTLVKYIDVPMWVHMDQYDTKLLEKLGDKNDPAKNKALAKQVRDMLEKLDGAFGPADNSHVSLHHNRFHTQKVDGHRYREVFANWYFDLDGPKNVIEQPE